MIKAINSFLLAIVLMVSSQSTTFIEPPSPCPNVFRYVSPRDNESTGQGTEKWYGVVNLTTDITLHALWLNVILDNNADVLGNWIGEVTTEDNTNFKIENTEIKLTPDTTLSVRFFIQYKAKNTIPKLKKILLNGREICNADSNFVQKLDQNYVSNSNNYDVSKYMVIKNTTSTTTIKKPYRQETTPKPNWTVKLQNQQLITESPSRLEASKSENKASSTWGSVQSKIENKQTVKSSDNQQMKYSQAIVKNDSQSSLMSKTENREFTENNVSKNKNLAQTWQMWPERQATTETNVYLVYGSTSDSKPTAWTGNNQETRIDSNGQGVVSGDKLESQRWPQIIIDSNNNNTRSDGQHTSLHSPTGNSYNKAQVWMSTHHDNNKQITQNTESRRKDNKPIVNNTANPNYYIESYDHNVQTRPVNNNRYYEEFEVLSEEATTTISPGLNPGSTTLRYADEEIEDDNRKMSSPNRYQSTDDRPSSNIPVPIIEDSVNYNPAEQQQDIYFSGGIPTLYIPNQRPESSCGKVTKKPPTYLPPHSTTSEGQWPWQVAIYQQQTVDFKYICAGTLVSYRHVITAAHCVARKESRREINKNTLTVYLGKFNLRTSIEGVQIRFVNKIIIHPDYNAMIFSRDLAILELREYVSYTDWVRPACLWPDNETGLRSIVGKKGSIVGWDSDVTDVPKEELNLLEMQVVAQETCINSYLAFYEKFTSDYTYCAEYTDGNSACNGDSGGGMVFKKGNTWYLRGLASISVARTNEYRCDPTQYVIFTDIAKFLPWIEKNID